METAIGSGRMDPVSWLDTSRASHLSQRCEGQSRVPLLPGLLVTAQKPFGRSRGNTDQVDVDDETIGNELGAALQAEFGPYLVPLGVRFTPDGKDQGEADQFVLYSGFLVSIRESLFWVTAGHTFSYIEHDKARGFWVSACSLIERGKVGGSDVSLSFEALNVVAIDEDGGIDVGWFEIPPLQRELLKRGPLPTLSSKNVAPHTMECDGYAVVGVPGEPVGPETRSDSTGLSYATVILALKLIEIETPGDGFPRMVFQAMKNGAIIEGVPLQSVKGMSGGLVVGLKRDGESTSFIAVGIQSAWDKAMWRLKVIPLWPVVEHIRRNVLGTSAFSGTPSD